MAIPFRDEVTPAPAGTAAFLTFESEEGGGTRAALFVINARGEPVEFGFARVDGHSPFLWRRGDHQRSASAALCRVLFPALVTRPDLLLVRADTPASLFVTDIRVELATCRVGTEATAYGSGETPEPLEGTTHLFWIGQRPAADSTAGRLIDTLIAGGLLEEPFERALIGLSEGFGVRAPVVD